MGDIEKIRALIVEYYNMEYGCPIHNHLELLKFDDGHEIYISRRSLKHFVESRRQEMLKSHTKEQILYNLYFMVDNLVGIYLNYDEFKSEGGRLIYVRYFPEINKNMRMVTEDVCGHFEICSIHFQKNKKPP